MTHVKQKPATTKWYEDAYNNMIIVDIETTGLDPEKNSILSIGAVDFNNQENRFYGECRVWKGAEINQEALDVNGFDHNHCYTYKGTERRLIFEFIAWALKMNSRTIAGANPSFDLGFLKAACRRHHIFEDFNHRTIDIQSIAWFYFKMKNITPRFLGLSLDTILDTLGLDTETKPHNALKGALCSLACFNNITQK